MSRHLRWTKGHVRAPNRPAGTPLPDQTPRMQGTHEEPWVSVDGPRRRRSQPECGAGSRDIRVSTNWRFDLTLADRSPVRSTTRSSRARAFSAVLSTCSAENRRTSWRTSPPGRSGSARAREAISCHPPSPVVHGAGLGSSGGDFVPPTIPGGTWRRLGIQWRRFRPTHHPRWYMAPAWDPVEAISSHPPSGVVGGPGLAWSREDVVTATTWGGIRRETAVAGLRTRV